MASINDPETNYDRLIKGKFKTTDLLLTFIEQQEEQDEDEEREKQQTSRRREQSVHLDFMQSCNLIQLAMEGNRFAESSNKKINIHVPKGTFGEIDGLLQWCYDGSVRCTDADGHNINLPALWSLADYMQCPSLCEAIIKALRTSVSSVLQPSGAAFSQFCRQATYFGATTLLEAAICGLPLTPNTVDQQCPSSMYRNRDDLDRWLDYGGCEMLGSLLDCVLTGVCSEKEIAEGGGKVQGEKKDDEPVTETGTKESLVLIVLGEYLGEMRREDRDRMPPSLFAKCLARFPPGTVSEAQYASMVLDYVEDQGSNIEEFTSQALLASVDFCVIAKDQLIHNFIPRIQDISFALAMTIHDIASVASVTSPISTMRCAYSASIIQEDDQAVILDCGHILLSRFAYLFSSLFSLRFGGTVTNASPAVIKNASLRCPVCKEEHRNNQIFYGETPNRWGGWVHVHSSHKKKLQPLKSYMTRKSVKADVLNSWASTVFASSQQMKTNENPRKRARPIESHLVQADDTLFVGVVDSLSSVGSDSTVILQVDSLETSLRDIIGSFCEMVKLKRTCWNVRCLLRRNGELQLNVRIPLATTLQELEFDPDSDMLEARWDQSGC